MSERDSHRYAGYACLVVGVPLAVFNRMPVAIVGMIVAAGLNLWIARRMS